MTNEDIIKLAMEYGFTGGFDAEGNLTYDATFVEAVTEAVAATRKETLEEMIYAHPTTAIEKAVAYEREACAQVCDELDSNSYPYVVVFPNKCAEAIRARSILRGEA